MRQILPLHLVIRFGWFIGHPQIFIKMGDYSDSRPFIFIFSAQDSFQQFLILVKLLQELKVYFHLSGMIWIKLLLILAPPTTSLKQWQYRVDQRINPNNPRLLNIFQYICSYSCGEYSWEKCMNETSFPVHPRSLLWMWYSDRRYSRFWQRGCPFRSRWMDVN